MRSASNLWMPLVAIIALSGIAPLSAQQANVGIWQGGNAPTVLVNSGPYAGDPYATVGVPTPWFGGGRILPTGARVQNRLWGRIEYLRWWTEGMDIPHYSEIENPEVLLWVGCGAPCGTFYGSGGSVLPRRRDSVGRV